MRIFFWFLKRHAGYFAYTAVCLLAFAFLFWLCELPMKPVLYGFSFCLALGCLLLLGSFVRFYRKHRVLSGIRTEILDTLEHLPRPDGLLERDYQALLADVYAEKSRLSNAEEKSRQELLDYYTLWVHQIKTPIAAMQLILESDDTPEHLELRGELFRIRQYVEMVLCYLRLEGPASDFRFRECSLDRVLRAAVRTYAGQFIRQRIRLVYEPVEQTALTDDKWLQFVVEQLLSNALKYTKSGSVTITAEGEGRIVIRDTGIGIAAEDLPRIFEWGFTGLNGRGGQRSTGIGLYLCSRVMERLGHHISIDSQPGQGTAVTLELSRRSLDFD